MSKTTTNPEISTNSTCPIISLAKAKESKEFLNEYIPISSTEAVGKTYVLNNLRRMGPILFNNPDSTNICLHLNDEKGNVAKIWVHDFYFLHESYSLYQLLHQSSKPNTPEAEDHNPFELLASSMEEKAKVRSVYLTVPSVEGIEPLLRWIYTREDNMWLDTMTEENFESVMENVAFFRLNQEAYYVMAQFYENL